MGSFVHEEPVYPFHDRPDIGVPVIWYPVDETTAVLPYASPFVLRAWDKRDQEIEPVVGTRYAPPTSFRGPRPAPFVGHVCGTPEQWLNGVSYADYLARKFACDCPIRLPLPDFAAAVLWLLAEQLHYTDGTHISFWRDNSTAGNDTTQAADALRPIARVGAAEFGPAAVLSLAHPIDLASQGAVFVVGTLHWVAPNAPVWHVLSDTATGSIFPSVSPTDFAAARPPASATVAQAFPSGVLFLASVVWAAGQAVFFRNGVQIGAPQPFAPASALTLSAVGLVAGGGVTPTKDLVELLLLETAPTSDNLHALHDYYVTKYNLPEEDDVLPGSVIGWAGPSAPADYLDCDGAAVNRVTFSRLFQAIGTAFGAGDGVTTFNVPDFRGRTIIGVGTGPGLTARALADLVGEETHQLTKTEMPVHQHSAQGGAAFVDTSAGTEYVAVAGTKGTTVASTANAGSNQAHNNMQPSGAAFWIIKT